MPTLYKNLLGSHCSRYETPVGAMMTRNPFSINDAATIQEAAAFLLERNLDASPVINEAGRPIGVVSVADIVRYLQEHGPTPKSCSHVRVKEVMNRELYFVRPSKPVGEVVDALLRSGFARLYVIDDNTVLIGVVSRRDLLRYINTDRPAPVCSSQRRAPRFRRQSTPVAHPVTSFQLPPVVARHRWQLQR